MGRKILFITTDQQRFDALGCNGGLIARTPNIDALAATGINYNRAHPQNVVCMPSRSTMITGQHVATHGVWMNGVPLPNDAPSVATTLHDAGYKTALIGKAHFEPFLDPFLRFVENQLANTGAHSLIEDGHLHRGFDHMESASHGGMGSFHYAQWLMKNHPEAVPMYYRVLDMSLQVSAEGGGDTGAPQAHINNIPREWYHTDWVADRAIAWLDSLDADADWFCWVSFPDPHHPWDPPASETHRVVVAAAHVVVVVAAAHVVVFGGGGGGVVVFVFLLLLLSFSFSFSRAYSLQEPLDNPALRLFNGLLLLLLPVVVVVLLQLLLLILSQVVSECDDGDAALLVLLLSLLSAPHSFSPPYLLPIPHSQ